MCDPNIQVFTVESFVFRVIVTKFGIVDVAVNASKRFELSQRVRYVHSSEIARVPDFVAVLEVFEDQRIKKTVCVRNESDSLHAC